MHALGQGARSGPTAGGRRPHGVRPTDGQPGVGEPVEGDFGEEPDADVSGGVRVCVGLFGNFFPRQLPGILCH